jgi:hypothetical protein
MNGLTLLHASSEFFRFSYRMSTETPTVARPLFCTHPRRSESAQRRSVKFGRKVKLTHDRINHARKLIDKGEARQYLTRLRLRPTRCTG